MVPSFGTLFGEPISPYFTFVAIAFLVCTWISVRWAKQMRLDHEILIDLALISVITGVTGARIAHVLFDGYFMDYVHMCTDPSQVGWQITREECGAEWVDGNWDAAASVCRPKSADCFAWARFWAGGLTWYGGMFLAVGYAMYFLKKEKFPRLKALDLGGLMLPVGLFFGRLGCFFGGCCFGAVTESHWGLVFPRWSPASEQQWKHHLLAHPSLPSLSVVPTQLLEAGGCLALAFFAFLLWHPRKRYDGQVFVWSMGGYAVLRFLLEYLRDDDRGGVFAFSTSQWLSLFLFVFLAAMSWRLRKQSVTSIPIGPGPLAREDVAPAATKES